MCTAKLNVWKVRSTDAAYGVAPCKSGSFEIASRKFLWIPKGKISESVESDLASKEIVMEGENLGRIGLPLTLTVDAEFLAKVKADQFTF